MSFNYTNNSFDSEDGSNSSLNPCYYNINNNFLSSNYEHGLTIDIINGHSSVENKSNNDINKNKDETKKKLFNVENVDRKTKGSKASNKKQIKYLHKSDDTQSSTHQISNNKERKESTNDIKSDKEENTSSKKSAHTKFSDDNMRKKCKFIVLNHMMNYINQKIKEKYKYIGHGITMKKIMTINKSQISNAKIDYNQIFMNKTLEEIFSDNISTRYTNYPQNKNEILIKEILNDEDEDKKRYFKKLFSLTFLDCLKHFVNQKSIEELNGLELYEEMKKNPKELKKKNIDLNDKEYLVCLDYHLKEYAEILGRKRKRNRNKYNEKSIMAND